MVIRDRFALAVMGLSAGALTTLAALANLEATPRTIDIVILWLVGALQLGLVLVWVFIPRLPRWIIAGWGLIMAALGVGDIIAVPVPAGASAIPWALIGLVVVGVITTVMSIVHAGGDSSTTG
jgi:hypothetical protein